MQGTVYRKDDGNIVLSFGDSTTLLAYGSLLEVVLPKGSFPRLPKNLYLKVDLIVKPKKPMDKLRYGVMKAA